MKVTSNIYRISRTDLSRIGSEEYIRSFWWLVATIPFFGILCLIFGRGALQLLGWFCILWPFSIPARGVLSSSKASRLFTTGCHVEAVDGDVTFIGEPGKKGTRLRYQIPLHMVRDVTRRRDVLLIRMRLLGFAPIRVDAFRNEKDCETFVKIVEAAIEQRLSQS